VSRSVFTLRVRAAADIDEVRALRGWLKVGFRTFGLRCLEIEQSNRRTKMDMRKFGSGVIRPEDLDEPRVEKIVNIYENTKHEVAVLVFASGDELFLWNNLARVLSRAWGWNSEDYIGQEVEISRGGWLDRRDNPPTEKDCINIRAVSPPKAEASNGGTSLRKAIDDDIPFAPEWR
jgi:hypothetical protein